MPHALERDWRRLVEHVATERSDLVLLPEMPFAPWFAVTREFDAQVWRSAVLAHDAWLERLVELAPASILGTRPVERHGERLNEAFVWSQAGGYKAAHHKYFLPNEDGFWESCWYRPGDGSFDLTPVGDARVGFQICTELWAMDQARAYGKAGAHIIATPRATPQSTLEKWLIGGRAAAVCAGAYSLSSNHVSDQGDTAQLGGQGWIAGPDGEIIGITTKGLPVVSAEIDLARAEHAKSTYPRYVF